MGRTVTQLPVVTSLSVAGMTSVTFVVEVKFTVALVLSSLVTWMELPATEAISPLTLASPWAGAGDVVVEVTVDVEVEVDVGADLFDEPHAATDSAVAPVTARMANRVSPGLLAVINACPPIVNRTSECEPGKGLPDAAVRGLCDAIGQKASSGTRMMSPSIDSITERSGLSFGSMFLAKNAAVAILPR
ncbi:hypothetical protein BN971_03481 [Mycobacterium bohemicum DSM 44277]|uniref:Uncharacterized protein n=1 Tax=Mycobacterium bohemicum DSM 44277 TaxID=1236609 RepID=A0A0U0WBG5_MYCBE|nr:hypothetical protein BN971_03481 [Mycobacterium bohemicum DSM 44277]